jgi:hypothetical protein
MSEFHPLPPPTSAGVENTKTRDDQNAQKTHAKYESAVESLTPYDHVDTMYKRFMPDYQKQYPNSQHNVPYHTTNRVEMNDSQDESTILIQKLNYMINLLEEQQDERTNNVTEEVILYSFLGIFIIFIVDSFVRVGRYIR